MVPEAAGKIALEVGVGMGTAALRLHKEGYQGSDGESAVQGTVV